MRIVEQDLARYQTLIQRGSISRQTVEQSEAEAARLPPRYAATTPPSTPSACACPIPASPPLSPAVSSIRNVDVGNLLRTDDSNGLFSVTRMCADLGWRTSPSPAGKPAATAATDGQRFSGGRA
ncbi:MAG: hypothetical protein QM805_20260 [Pseudomonas sp.]